MSVFTLVMLPAVVSLGFWQLSRGAEKRAMEMDYLTRLTDLPAAVDQLDAAERFQRIRFLGQFSDEIFLVDNQVHQGRTGYWIVQVFDTINGLRLLVNRGFIAAPQRREELPETITPSGTIELVGTLWPFTGLIPVLDDDPWPEGWPKRVQRLDVERMAAAVGARAAEVRLEPGQPGVETAAPFAKVLSDAKHLGYAATWFGLALVLTAGYVAFGIRNATGMKNEKNNQNHT
jgi:cytochrome oxidase assembly protein ShyY1